MSDPKKPLAQEKKAPPSLPAKAEGGLVAKKDFVLCHNEFFLEIKAGDDLKDVPEMFLANLKTEGVL